MAQGIKIKSPEAGHIGAKGVTVIHHQIVTGTSGAISSQSTSSGATATKTGGEVGRYSFVLNSRYKKLLNYLVTVDGPADATYGAVSVGLMWLKRNDLVASAGTVDMQAVNASTNFTDAEVPNGTTISFTFFVEAGV